MGAAAPECKLETRCFTMGQEDCCHVDRCEDEFSAVVSHDDEYIPCNKKATVIPALAKVNAISTLAEENEPDCPFKQMPEYAGFPCPLTGHWDECAATEKFTANDRREDGPDYDKESCDMKQVQQVDLDGSLKAQELARVSLEGVPLDDGVELLSPQLIQDLLKNRKCVLVDVRGADRASGIIEGALYVPAVDMNAPFIARLPELVQDWTNERLIVFFCQFSKHRAPHCANLYRAQSNSMQRVAVMEGGFRGWQSKGLPVQDGGGTASERATADALALHQGALIRSQLYSIA